MQDATSRCLGVSGAASRCEKSMRALVGRVFMWSDDVVRFELNSDGEWVRSGPSDFTFEHDAQGRLMKWAHMTSIIKDGDPEILRRRAEDNFSLR